MENEEKKLSGKEKVLLAAEEVFAESGFEGSTVDHIAEVAQINKMLIYYHFKNKDEILKELLKKHLNDTVNHISDFFPKSDILDEKYIEQLVLNLMDFFEKKRNILKIFTIEGIKLSTKDTTIFELIEPVTALFLEKFKEFGLDMKDKLNFYLREFFVGTIPLIIYFSLGDKWAEFYGFDKDKTKIKFIEIYKDMIAFNLKIIKGGV